VTVLLDTPPGPHNGSKQKKLSSNFLEPPVRWQGWVVSTQIGGLECWLAQNKIQERGVVGLDNKEKDLLERDVKQRGTNNDMAGIAPDACANKVRIPRKGRGDSNLQLSARMAFQNCGRGRTLMRKRILKTSILVNRGRYSNVSSTAGGMVYLAWLCHGQSRSRQATSHLAVTYTSA
jgi:hypothetical protein